MKYPYGREILITGASSGLGKAAAEAFARAGYTVWGVSRHASGETESFGDGKICSLAMDVCEEGSVENALSEIERRGGTPRTVLHCAGFGIGGAAEDTPLEDAHAQLETNFFGVLRVNKALLPHLRRLGGGLVLLVGSVAGLIPIPYQGHYSASKFALEAYAETLRMEAKKYHIRVCLLEPGDTKTGFTASRRLCIPEDSPYKAACLASVEKMAKDEQNGDSPEKFARTALRMSQRKKPPVRRIIGLPYRLLVFFKRFLPASIVEWVLSLLYVPRV